MAKNANAETDEPTNEQAEYVKQIEKIVVDPDDVLTHYAKNLRNEGSLYTPRKFRLVGFKRDGVAEVDIGVDPRDEGAYYDGSPHPIWINPGSFVRGGSPGENGGRHKDIGLPDKSENRRILRGDASIDPEDGTEEFEEIHQEAMEEWEELWEAELRNDLKDELEFEFRAVAHHPEYRERTVTHTVEIEYDD